MAVVRVHLSMAVYEIISLQTKLRTDKHKCINTLVS